MPTLRASALYYGMVVWAAVLGAVFLGESVDAYGGCGAAVIALGGLLPSVRIEEGRGGKGVQGSRGFRAAGWVVVTA